MGKRKTFWIHNRTYFNAATKILETKNLIMAALYGKSLARVAALASKNALKRPISTSQKALVADKMTHTGQSWEDNDPRSLRFMDKTKVVACHGGSNPALGHPKVYINLDSYEPVTCIYCGLQYMYRKEPVEATAQN